MFYHSLMVFFSTFLIFGQLCDITKDYLITYGVLLLGFCITFVLLDNYSRRFVFSSIKFMGCKT